MNERQKDLLQKFAALAGLLLLVLVFSLTSSAFFSSPRFPALPSPSGDRATWAGRSATRTPMIRHIRPR